MASNYVKAVDPDRPFDLTETRLWFFDDGIPAEVDQANRFARACYDSGLDVSVLARVKTFAFRYWPEIGADPSEQVRLNEDLEAEMSVGWSARRACRVLREIRQDLAEDGSAPEARLRITRELEEREHVTGKQRFEDFCRSVLGFVPEYEPAAR